MDNGELSKRYDEIIERCVSVFKAKTKDYGPTWLFFRDQSFIDQLWIKARRIRTLEENGDKSLVGEGREDEYLGIVNYGVIMLMRMQNPELFPDSDAVVADTEAYYTVRLDDMEKEYRRAFAGVKALMERKNHDYGAAWTEMHLNSITDQIIVKIFRMKNIIASGGRLIASEGLDAQISDVINYSIFALLKMSGIGAQAAL